MVAQEKLLLDFGETLKAELATSPAFEFVMYFMGSEAGQHGVTGFCFCLEPQKGGYWHF